MAQSSKLPPRGGRLDYEAIAEACRGRSEPTKMDLLDWVFNHVGLKATSIPLDDWPSVGAVRLLEEANANYPKFLDLWAKTIPNQTQLKVQERAKDDGRALTILEALEAEFANPSPEGAVSQPPLPEGDSGTGGVEQVGKGGDSPPSEPRPDLVL